MTGRSFAVAPAELGDRVARILGEQARGAAAVADPKPTGGTPSHLFLSEIFIRQPREEATTTDYLCLVSIDAQSGDRGELHVVGPGALRSRSAAIAPGLLVGPIPVCPMPRGVQRIGVVLLGVSRRQIRAREVLRAIQDLADALDFERDPEGSSAVALGILDRVELLRRSMGARLVAGGVHEVGPSADQNPRHLLFATGAADPARRFRVEDGHLSVVAAHDAATAWREQEFVLVRVGPLPEMVDVDRSMDDLRRLHVATQGTLAPEPVVDPVESYQERAHRLGTLSRLTGLFGKGGIQRLPFVTPIAVEAAADLGPLLVTDGDIHPQCAQRLAEMRADLGRMYGLELPGTRVRLNDGDLPSGSYIIIIREIPLVMGTLTLGRALCTATVGELAFLGVTAEPATDPASGDERAWISEDDVPRVHAANIRTLTADGYIVLHLSAVLRKNLATFADIQVVANLLRERARGQFEQIRAAAGGLPRFTSVLRALLVEEVSIRELPAICDRYLATQHRPTHEIAEEIRCLEPVRAEIAGNSAETPVFELGPGFAELMAGAIKRDGDAAVLALEPEPTQDALSAVRQAVGDAPARNRTPVLLVDDWRIRSFVRKLIELEFPHLAVLSRREAVAPDAMPVVGTIDVEPLPPWRRW